MLDQVDILYDITIAIADVNGEKPTLKHIKDGVPVKAQIYFRRIPMSSLPLDDEKKCADYLQNLYREKVYDQIDFNLTKNEFNQMFYLKRMPYLTNSPRLDLLQKPM